MEQSLDLESSSSQYASASDSASLSITGALTVEAWCKFESIPGFTVRHMIASKFHNNDASTVTPWEFSVVGTSSVTRSLTASVQQDPDASPVINASATSTLAFQVGVWMHLAFIYDPSVPIIKLYRDGAEVSSYTSQFGTATSIWDSTGVLLVGAGNLQVPGGSINRFCDGKISSVRIWDVVRTEAEINDNKCVQIDSATNLKASWTLDGVYTDGSGNSNTLTPVNSPNFSSDAPGCLLDFTPHLMQY